ncbi:UNVERIFIED_CONTAM: hypothetical protein PYX00_011426 [Menopon gallinae]|uniref:Helicase ATP-binding domain-containing protein n=1 Tax=Menopon gallinae TaxID=328185 RepID=A0AAW2H7F2_9NEOP
MPRGVQHNCERDRTPETLRPSVTPEGYVLLLPQNETVVSTIQGENPEHIKYDGAHWVFSLDIQKEVIRKLRRARMMISTAVCRYITDVFCAPAHRHADLAAPVRRRLYDFQVLAVEKASRLQGRVLLGDASGLGKKYQALAIASCIGDNRPTLIVCSSVCIGMWQALARELLGTDLAVVKKKSDLRDSSCITVHAQVVKHIKEFSSVGYGLVIVDDAHVFAKRGTYIEKCFTEMLRKTERVVLVTAAARRMSIAEWRRYKEFPGELMYLTSHASLIRDRGIFPDGNLGADTGPSRTEHGGRPESLPRVHRRVIDCGTACQRTPSVSLGRWSRELRSRYKREARRKHRLISAHLKYLLGKGLRVAVVVHFKSTARALMRHAPAAEYVFLDGASREGDTHRCTQFNTGDAPAVIATYRALKTCSFLRVDTVCVAELHPKAEYISRAEGVSGHRVMADVHYLVERGGVERCLWEAIEKRL